MKWLTNFLKKLFGTPKDGEEPKAMTYAELEAAIDADKKIQVVDVKAGGYVSKEKLDAKITELDRSKTAVVRCQYNDSVLQGHGY